MLPFLTFPNKSGPFIASETWRIHRNHMRARKHIYKGNRTYYDEIYKCWRNRWGFRTHQDYLPATDWVVFGCSHTYGVGLKREERWADILEQELGQRIYNVARPGCGWDYIWLQLAHRLLFTPLPPKVIIQTPPPARLSIVKKNNEGTVDFYHHDDNRFLRIAGIDNVKHHSMVVEKLVIKHLRRAHIDFHILDWEAACAAAYPTDWARDLSHLGPNTNLKIAQQLRSSLRSGSK